MSISTLTSKGQITIPKQIRERLHLRTGDKLDFHVDEGGSIRVHPVVKRVAEVFGAFSHKASHARSTAEIERELKRAFREGRV